MFIELTPLNRELEDDKTLINIDHINRVEEDFRGHSQVYFSCEECITVVEGYLDIKQKFKHYFGEL